MSSRTAKQMVMDTIEELDDATDAMLIVSHADGTLSWHSTTSTLSTKMGLVRYVEVCLDMDIRSAHMIDEHEDEGGTVQ